MGVRTEGVLRGELEVRGGNDNIDLIWVRTVGDFLPGLLLFQYSYFCDFL